MAQKKNITKLKLSLMYHDLYSKDPSESGFQGVGALQYKLAATVFENQIVKVLEKCKFSPDQSTMMAVTFDDGGISAYTLAAPILEKYGLRGYFFVTTGLIDTPGFLTREQIIELDQRGHIIGAHSHTHPRNISMLSPKQIDFEWKTCVKILTQILGKPIRVASIPGGFYSDPSRISLSELGIDQIFTSRPTHKVVTTKDNQNIMGRFTIKNNTPEKALLRFVENKFTVQFFALLKWRFMNSIRSILGRKYYKIRESLLRH